MPKRPDVAELSRHRVARLIQIRLPALDVNDVLSDNSRYFSSSGEPLNVMRYHTLIPHALG